MWEEWVFQIKWTESKLNVIDLKIHETPCDSGEDNRIDGDRHAWFIRHGQKQRGDSRWDHEHYKKKQRWSYCACPTTFVTTKAVGLNVIPWNELLCAFKYK